MAYVSGLAGRGKTTLALEYAQRYQRDFEAVHLLPCQGRTLVQMAGELAWQLGLKLDGEVRRYRPAANRPLREASAASWSRQR